MLRRLLSSLVGQLLIVLVLATAVPLGLSVVEAQRTRAEAEQRAAESAAESATLVAGQVADVVGTATGAARILGEMPALLEGDDAARDNTLSVLAGSEPYFTGLLYFTPDFMEHGSSNHQPGSARVDLSGRAYAQEAVATGQLALASEPLRALTSSTIILPVAVPVRPASAVEPTGFLVAGLGVDGLPRLWSRLPLPSGTTVMLIDSRGGRVLTGSGDAAAIVGQSISAENLERLHNGSVDWVSTNLRGGQTRLRAAAAVEATPWIVAVDVPRASIIGPADAEMGRRVATAAAVGAVTLTALVLLWSRLLHRVQKLRVAAAKWAAGDWRHRSGMRGRDELGYVALALDAMAEERQAAERALRESQEHASEAQRRHAEHLSRIIAAQTDIAQQALDQQQLMKEVVDRVPSLTGGDGAVVELVDGDEMVYAAASGSAAQHVGLRLKVEGSFSGLCVRSDQLLVSCDSEDDPRVDREATRKVNVRSMVVAPLKYDGRVVGALKVLSARPNEFDEGQVATLELMAGVLGGALGHAQAYAERTVAEAQAKALAERLEAVLRAASEVAIIGVGLDNTVTLFNTGAERMLGYSSSEVLGRRPRAILDVDEITQRARERGLSPAEVFTAPARRDEAASDEWTFIRKDGSRLTVLLSVTALRGDDGALVGYIGIAIDITERKAIEEMKDQFVSMVSHELKTPLTSIRGSLGLLAGGLLGPLPERGQRMVNIAVENTDRLLRLINDILDLERMRSGRIQMERVDSDLAALMCESVEVMRGMAENAGVRLEAQPIAMPMCADPDRIIQVLTNLVSNAIKFSEPGGCVRMRALRAPDRVRIEVQDHGRGIPADKLETIFERFQQVDASDARAKGGTGLGLAISRTIVEQHGGRIWAESVLGEGTTMIVELPTS